MLVPTPFTSAQTFKDFISNPPQPGYCDGALRLTNHTCVMVQSYGGGVTNAPPTSPFGSSWKRSRGETTASPPPGAVDLWVVKAQGSCEVVDGSLSLVAGGKPSPQPAGAETPEVGVVRASSPPVTVVQAQTALPEAIPCQRPKVGAKKSLSGIAPSSIAFCFWMAFSFSLLFCLWPWR